MDQSKEAIEKTIKEATENLARKEEARESAETRLEVATRALKEAAQAMRARSLSTLQPKGH